MQIRMRGYIISYLIPANELHCEINEYIIKKGENGFALFMLNVVTKYGLSEYHIM